MRDPLQQVVDRNEAKKSAPGERAGFPCNLLRHHEGDAAPAGGEGVERPIHRDIPGQARQGADLLQDLGELALPPVVATPGAPKGVPTMEDFHLVHIPFDSQELAFGLEDG